MKFAQSSIEDTQALALWYFTKECNFHCPYCKIGRANSDHGIARRFSTMGKKIMRRLTGLPADPLEGSSKIIKLLKNEEGKKWTIGLTGGEPFMYPRFVDLCETLTEHFCIYVDTNLSISRRVAEFAKRINPDRVDFLYISTHIAERERRNQVDDFIGNILLLQERGFNCRVSYVLQPSLISRFMKDHDYFREKGVTLMPKPFKGEFQGKRYPQAYTGEEKKLLSEYNPCFQEEIPVKSRGIKCDAGRLFIRISPDGRVTRCVGDKTVLGHISKGITFDREAQPCQIDTCPCFGQLFLRHH